MENPKKIPSKMQIESMGKKFFKDRLSAAGFSYVVTEKSRRRKTIRAILLLMIMSFMILMTINVVREYLTYPKVLINEVENNISLEFPAVTICSTSPVSREDIRSSKKYPILEFEKFLKSAKPTTSTLLENYREACDTNPMCRWSWFTNSCHCVKAPCVTGLCISEEGKDFCACHENLCDWPYLRDNGACIRIPEAELKETGTLCKCHSNFNYSLRKENPEFKANLDEIKKSKKAERNIEDSDIKAFAKLMLESKTNDLSDIYEDLLPPPSEIFENDGITNINRVIVSCSFDKAPCTHSDFRVLRNPMLGECYMFNYIGNEPSLANSVRKIYNYGGSSGLQIILNTGSVQDKVDLLSPNMGFRVAIHNPRHMPFMLEHGSLVRMGSMTAIGVTLSSMQRLGKPYGECQPDTWEEPYVQLECRKKCRLSNIYERCSCYKKSFLLGMLNNRSYSGRYCDSRKEDANCVTEVINDIEKEIIKCDCPPPCFQKSYLITLSNSRINDGFYRTVQGIKTMKLKKNVLKKLETHAQNFSGLKVFYQTLRIDQCNEMSSYSNTSFCDTQLMDAIKTWVPACRR